ncbi:hypothetical protein JMJ78_0015220 [Colletotrichum scovillei]|nr:hypothetical protein JMJ78_0015220 [Colletotrichum scovillei]
MAEIGKRYQVKNFPSEEILPLDLSQLFILLVMILSFSGEPLPRPANRRPPIERNSAFYGSGFRGGGVYDSADCPRSPRPSSVGLNAEKIYRLGSKAAAETLNTTHQGLSTTDIT